METISIITPNGHVLPVPANDESNVHRSINGDDYVELIFNSLNRGVNDYSGTFDNTFDYTFTILTNLGYIPAMSTIVHNGETFYLLDDYRPKKNGEAWHYQVKFESLSKLLYQPIFYRYYDDGTGVTIRERDFIINANIDTIGSLFLQFLQDKLPNWAWQFDNIFGDSELKLLTFEGLSLGEALDLVCSENETEWWLEQTNNPIISSSAMGASVTLKIGKCSRGATKVLSTNKDNQAYYNIVPFEITRQNNTPSKVFIYGGTQNMPRITTQNQSFRNRLRLPNNQEYISIANGRPHLEAIKIFEDIYPFQKMKVWGFDTRVSGDITYWRVMPYNTDNKPILSANVLPGNELKIHFQTGVLAGREFGAKILYQSIPDATVISPPEGAAIWIEIIPDQTDDYIIPSGPLVPNLNDEFIFLGNELEQTYINNAQALLLEKATEYCNNLSKNIPGINIQSLQGVWKNQGISLVYGQPVSVNDYQLVDSLDEYYNTRVVELSYPLYRPYTCDFTLSAGLNNGGRLRNIESQINTEITAREQLYQTARSISRVGWQNATEMTTMFESLQTEVALIGNEDNQFVTTSPFQANKDNNKNRLYIGAGTLLHTIYPKPDGGGQWNMVSLDFTIAENKSDIPFYVYAICYKEQNGGVYYLSEERLDVGGEDYHALHPNEAGAWCFICGTLSSVMDNRRTLNITSGFTLIAGGSITTEKIQDANGNLIIDLSANPPTITAQNGAIIQGNILFKDPNNNQNVTPQQFDVNKNSINYFPNKIDLWQNLSVGNDAMSDFIEIPAIGVKPIFFGGANTKGALAYETTLILYDKNKNQQRSQYINITKSIRTITSMMLLNESKYFRIKIALMASNDFDVNSAIEQEHLEIYLNNLPQYYIQPPARDYLQEVIKGGTTEIQGGLVASGVMMVKDNQNIVKGGVSGADDNIAFWAGGTYNQAINESVKSLIRKDGSGFFAGKNILWDIAGNLTIQGIIKALAGNIGAFKIVDNKIEYWDDNNKRKISLSYQDITVLDALKNGIWQPIVYGQHLAPNSITGRQGDLITFQANVPFSVDSISTIRLPNGSNGIAQSEFTDDQGNRYIPDNLICDIAIKNIDTNSVVQPVGGLYSLDAGEYIATYSVHGLFPYTGNSNTIFTWNGAGIIYRIEAQEKSAIVEIGKNGITAFADETHYFYYSNAIGLEIRFGNNGIRINGRGTDEKSGIYYLKGSSWEEFI